jgi:hypothetical protein
MKTWEMIKNSILGDVWYSEVLGYPIIHLSKGFTPLESTQNIKASHNFLRAIDWEKVGHKQKEKNEPCIVIKQLMKKMKTWEMIKNSIEGDIWYSETLGYPILHKSRGFVSLNSKHNIKVSNNFLRASDWKKR